jgi:hypothetical protein
MFIGQAKGCINSNKLTYNIVIYFIIWHPRHKNDRKKFLIRFVNAKCFCLFCEFLCILLNSMLGVKGWYYDKIS